ncbi:MAG: efflux RND transporter periplasmic adaptor subunit, partial [Gammaproteobacteria bacterium]|nr:efflux RND transporter periplasmic adaptor subunit [Gammaproteobacteria bacterium]
IHLVETTTAGLETIRRTSRHTGTLRARRTLRVFSQEEGRIQALPFFEGDRVQKGAVLMRLDDALLRAELNKTIATRHQAELDLQRLERLIRRKAVAEDELGRARTALEVAQAEESVLRTRLGYTVERSPFTAVVSQRLAEPGDAVSRHTHLLTLTDPTSLVTELSVSELVLPQLRVGDPVQVRIDALGNRNYSGLVLRIHPTLDVRTRHGRVEVELTPVPEEAVAGQFCRVTLNSRQQELLLIPFSALRRDRTGEFVFRVDHTGQAKRIAVRSGQKLTDRIEILEGISPGDLLVVKGFLGLREGMKVKVVNHD